MTVSILGQAVRLAGKWYTLCAYCGAPMQLRFDRLSVASGMPCCLCCNPAFTDGTADAGGERVKPSDGVLAALKDVHRAGPHRCRFCGAPKPDGRPARAWRRVNAPLDVTDDNATLPPQLRHLWYCKAHYREWVATAHQELSTRDILSHLAHNARPIASSSLDAPA